jgi:hypothetical protein
VVVENHANPTRPPGGKVERFRGTYRGPNEFVSSSSLDGPRISQRMSAEGKAKRYKKEIILHMFPIFLLFVATVQRCMLDSA